MNVQRRIRRMTRVVALAAMACGTVQAQEPAVLAAETSDVAVLPPMGPHRVLVQGDLSANGANVIDADSDSLGVLGQVPLSSGGLMALSGDASRIFVIETFYSRGNRGTREDVLAVYDGQTLNLLKEVVLPGRLLVTPRPQVFDVSEDGRIAYVYDMIPASGVHAVDLDRGQLLATTDLPGCALAFPYGARGFASICGDGTIATVQVPASGAAQAAFSRAFFQPSADPLFESSVNDRSTGEAWFLTYSGQLFPAKLAAAPTVGKPWSISVAAGFAQTGTGVQELAWRPGGSGRVLSLHRASKRLYVLMHTGNYWTHKAAGTEVWVLDAARQTLVKRIRLETPAQSIAVSQDANPLLYVMSDDDEFAVLDAATGETLRKRKLSGILALVPGY
jgi:methylamine dehydrogenase heavy chain